MIRIDKFFDLIKKYDLKIEGKHIIYGGNGSSKVARELCSALGEKRADDPRFRMIKRRCCLVKGCVSPQCRTFSPFSSAKNSYLDSSDFEDLAEDFDVYSYYVLGERAYMEEYNSHIPEGLRLSLGDFRSLARYCIGLEKNLAGENKSLVGLENKNQGGKNNVN